MTQCDSPSSSSSSSSDTATPRIRPGKARDKEDESHSSRVDDLPCFRGSWWVYPIPHPRYTLVVSSKREEKATLTSTQRDEKRLNNLLVVPCETAPLVRYRLLSPADSGGLDLVVLTGRPLWARMKVR